MCFHLWALNIAGGLGEVQDLDPVETMPPLFVRARVSTCSSLSPRSKVWIVPPSGANKQKVALQSPTAAGFPSASVSTLCLLHGIKLSGYIEL